MILLKRKFQIKTSNVEIEPQEVLMDALVAKSQENGSFNYQLEVPLRRRAVVGFWVCFVLTTIAVVARAFQFQILDHKELADLAQRNKFISSTVKAQRGVMYDKDLKQIVFNKSTFNLILDKAKLAKENESPDLIISKLANLMEIDVAGLKETISSGKENEVVVLKDLDYQKLLVFESSSSQFQGFKIKNESVRDYKDAFSMSQMLGYFRKTGQSTGIENMYGDYLSAKPGEMLYERDASGEITAERIVSLPESGKSLVLYLDSGLQNMLYQSLKIKLKDIGATKGAAIAMDPNTGGILAMVSMPSYDNNLFAGDISAKDWDALQNDKNNPLMNRAISGKFPTGSTIKPLIASAGLQEGIITPNTSVNCTGKIVVDNPYQKDKPYIFNDWSTHGVVNVKSALAESCNVFFFTVGNGYKGFKGLGVDRIKKYLDLFGWEDLTGIDLPGEISGFVPDPTWKKEKLDTIWYPGDTYNLSIGQGYLAATPLEVVTSFAAIANGGKLMKPKIVKAIVDENKKTIQEFQPEVVKENFIDYENIAVVRQGMREAVTYGSSVTLNSLPVKSASKTGTAEIGKKNYYHNWVTVFAPYEKPEIVITIMAENVQGLHTVTLPVAKEVLNWYFNRNNPPPLVEATSTNNLPTMEE